MSERDEQVALFDWAKLKRNQDYRYGYLVANPMQGGRGKDNIIRGQLRKREGAAKGFPDIMLLYPCGQYCGLFIELKVRGGSLSPEQRWWLNALNDVGYSTAVCVGFEEAKDVIETYLALED